MQHQPPEINCFSPVEREREKSHLHVERTIIPPDHPPPFHQQITTHSFHSISAKLRLLWIPFHCPLRPKQTFSNTNSVIYILIKVKMALL